MTRVILIETEIKKKLNYEKIENNIKNKFDMKMLKGCNKKFFFLRFCALQWAPEATAAFLLYLVNLNVMI